uniref:4-methyl-5(B-hydroxyethyl)-thiazole monophosphate biosynthesis n=1 Tax=Candidatus Kentrum sp. LPFa TaxID=2126335 RepID=A0A450W2C7_9GAMM|nr:MAG: 4-methyl-5(b-hydroxyethyl)-thiazole monophosphate biosynthesis [Candidatus Kentron sp. LPFa]VFK14881.1 MAG: 4-methyl-5(b-hydroxyethyl)-thiazole monophosphate biosynthesis [Candidatus Kentron sp. LPFa]VFK27527.1 MAG: 4-methyl-5(b-hydroxyethyl)-thiazole monophosphate biosynthesis [Candidatus Kentron sp. LPFa]
MSKKTVLIILGTGFEEIEALAPADLLRRAEISCQTASVESERWVTGRNGIRVEADVLLHEVEDQLFDALIIPGGPGTAELRKNPDVLKMIRAHHSEDRIIGAICAAPTVLLEAGVLPGPKHTGHMSIIPELPEIDTQQAVVVDGKVITSRGAGTAMEFGLAVAFVLTGQEVAEGVAKSIHYV